MRPREVRDVAGRIVDFLNLQRIDDQPELLHLGARRRTCRFRQLVAFANDLFDRQRADDRAQMAGEDVGDAHVHLLLLIQEPACRVRDRGIVVADFIDHDRLEFDRDALPRHAFHRQLRLAQIQRKFPHDLHARQDERSGSGHDFETQAVAELGMPLMVRHDDDPCALPVAFLAGAYSQASVRARAARRLLTSLAPFCVLTIGLNRVECVQSTDGDDGRLELVPPRR
jgi:hypothetical protein